MTFGFGPFLRAVASMIFEYWVASFRTPALRGRGIFHTASRLRKGSELRAARRCPSPNDATSWNGTYDGWRPARTTTALVLRSLRFHFLVMACRFTTVCLWLPNERHNERLRESR